MNIATKIRKAWKGVEDAHSQGFLNNHEMLAFSFCKPLSDIPESIPAIYDGRRLPDSEFKPNYFIWTNDRTPIVKFVGKIRFNPASVSEIKQDLTALRHSTRKPEIDVLTDTKGWTETRMQVSPEVQFGYFLLADTAINSVKKEIHHNLTDGERCRFHFAYGPIGKHDEQPQNFQYIPPQLAAD